MIPYSDPTLFYGEAVNKDLLITDGTVTVSGTSYSVAGATVTITNDLLEQEGFELHQSLCSESQITFGACESNYITFVMHENIPTVKGKTLSVYLIPDSDASKMLQIGVFKVQEDKLSADRTKRTVTAYDAMYDILNADVAGWYNSLLPNSNSSVAVGQMRFALTAYFGITQEAIVLANDSMVVKRTIEPESLSGADVIKALCEINGCFGQITNEGKFRYVELSPGIDDGLFPSDTLYPADDLYPQDVNHDVTMMPKAHYISVQFEDYNSEEITQLTIRTDDSDVGTTVGTAGNPYIIQGNFLVFGKNATELTTIALNCLDKIKNRYYKPCTVEAAGNPLHEVGDPIRVNTTYRGIVTYILQRTMRGIQALRDTYTAMGEEYTNQQLNSVVSRFKQLENKTLKIEADTDGLRIEVEEDYVSKDGVVGDLNNKMSSSINITSNQIAFNSTGTLVIDTTNLKLDASGNATFKGTIDGAQIKAGSFLYAYDTNSDMYAAMSHSGFFVRDISSGTMRTGFEAALGELYVREPSNYAGTNYFSVVCDSVSHNPTVRVSGNSGSMYIQPNEISLNSGTVRITGSDIKINGASVLTTNSQIPIPTTIKAEQIQNTSGNARINIDYGSSAYNIVLNGSVNIGNGSSNDIRIKGRDVRWKSYGSLTSSDYVLVENQV